MKVIIFGLMAALFLFPVAARADHHEVFIHGVYSLRPGLCAVELQIDANAQIGFEGVDRIVLNGVTLAALSDSVAANINAGGHTNAGDAILFASSAFQADTGLTADVTFDDGKCDNFVANSIFSFVVDDITFRGPNTVIDTLTAAPSFGVNLTAMTKSSMGAAAQFVDLNASTLTVKNNAGNSAVIGNSGGGGGGGGCGIVHGSSPHQAWLFYSLALSLLLSLRLRRSRKQVQASPKASGGKIERQYARSLRAE